MWAAKQIAKRDSASLVRDARDYALLHGLVLRYPDLESDNSVAHIPITLFPSPFPRKLYQECLDIQPIINNLMLAIANDSAFMDQSLRGVVQADEFTRNLLQVQKTVQSEGLAQPVVACINRSDYMLDRSANHDRPDFRVRQVEVNAIASSMSAHSCNTGSLHKYLMDKYRLKTDPSLNAAIPPNKSLQMVAQGLIDAYDSYGKSDTYILLVSEERSFNFSDQQLIELSVHKERSDIRIIRKRFIDLPNLAKLGPNRELLIDENKEIALVYFRYCYDPSNYNFQGAWDTRLLLERSRAIKCPSINFHLSGAKKFQQLLNKPEELEKFISSSDSRRLCQVFCKFWPIEAGTEVGEEGYRVGMSSAKNLVLKPQREGGGHNIYGESIKPFLKGILKPEDRSQYVLMEYIDSPQEKNWLLLANDESSPDLSSNEKLVSELGIFGSIIANGSYPMFNNHAGYLVRSKRFGVNEGGVASGYAGISSLMLFDDRAELSTLFDG